MWGRDTCSPPCCVEMLGKYVLCNPQLHGPDRLHRNEIIVGVFYDGAYPHAVCNGS
jgi:hypothetical protein